MHERDEEVVVLNDYRALGVLGATIGTAGFEDRLVLSLRICLYGFHFDAAGLLRMELARLLGS